MESAITNLWEWKWINHVLNAIQRLQDNLIKEADQQCTTNRNPEITSSTTMLLKGVLSSEVNWNKHEAADYRALFWDLNKGCSLVKVFIPCHGTIGPWDPNPTPSIPLASCDLFTVLSVKAINHLPDVFLIIFLFCKLQGQRGPYIVFLWETGW